MRATVSVIVPFLGDAAQAEALMGRLAALSRAPGDELIVADNTPESVVEAPVESAVTVVAVPDRRSAAHARNAAAATASGDWLLFLDADCVAPAGLLDSFLEPPPGDRCAIVAGEVVGDPAQKAILPRWARSRRGPWVAGSRIEGMPAAAITANMLVRREAFESAGGFRLGGGADFDLSWRLQDDGWQLEYRPQALVHHHDRETLREVAAQARSYGSDLRNLRRAHGSEVARPRLLRSGRALGGAAVWLARGQLESSRFALVDAVYHASAWLGFVLGGPRSRRAD